MVRSVLVVLMILAGGAIAYYVQAPHKLWALGVTMVTFGVSILLFRRDLLRKPRRGL